MGGEPNYDGVGAMRSEPQELPAPPVDALPPPDLLPPTADSVDLQAIVHDSSRFEWQVTLPLPRSGRVPYRVETEFEIPSNALSGRSPWDLFQGFTRLDGDIAPVGSSSSLKFVRQKAVALARMLDRARKGFSRHCLETMSHARCEESHDAHGYLTTWLDAALGAVATSREQLSFASPGDSPELGRERNLADEFISVRLLEFLADSQQVLEAPRESELLTDEEVKSSLECVDERLGAALDGELAYRRAHGFALADPTLPDTLEKYVERAGRLKKHFQEVLALEREAYPLDDRVQQWVATFSAMIAGMLVFGAQFVLGRWSIESRLSSGLAVIVLLAGIAYAARDRLKEVGRSWITGRMYRFHAQRIILCRLPSETDSKKGVIVRAREWCNETTAARPDPLNPESGASMRVTVVHHLHRGHLISNVTTAAAGVQRIRHVFRYDLSPLFSRLQDPVKRVPVMDATTRRALFVDAPRRYQLPLQVRVSMQDVKHEVRANLVLDKLGIRRLENQV
jgi:hypothetical protein